MTPEREEIHRKILREIEKINAQLDNPWTPLHPAIPHMMNAVAYLAGVVLELDATLTANKETP